MKLELAQIIYLTLAGAGFLIALFSMMLIIAAFASELISQAKIFVRKSPGFSFAAGLAVAVSLGALVFLTASTMWIKFAIFLILTGIALFLAISGLSVMAEIVGAEILNLGAKGKESSKLKKLIVGFFAVFSASMVPVLGWVMLLSGILAGVGSIGIVLADAVIQRFKGKG